MSVYFLQQSVLMAQSPDILKKLTAPLSPEDFWNRVFERQSLLTRNTGLLDSFDLQRFEDLLWAHEHLVGSQIDINKEGNALFYLETKAGKDPFRWLMEQYADGYTVIFNGLDGIDRSVAEIVRPLDRVFFGKTTANGFLTPPGSRGFLPHFDTHDVFILQVSGSKNWELYHQEKELPVDNQICLIDQQKLGSPDAKHLLKKGDVLYIPRGRVHGSFTMEDHSLHITIGIRPLLAVDYLETLLQVLSEEDEAFRKQVIIPFREGSPEEVQQLSSRLLEAAANPYIRKLTSERIQSQLAAVAKPMAGHHLDNLTMLEQLTLETQVRRSFPHHDALVDSGTRVRLVFPGSGFTGRKEAREGYLQFPATAYGALNFIRQRKDSFKPADLSDFYPDETKLTIVRLLLKEGYLKFG